MDRSGCGRRGTEHSAVEATRCVQTLVVVTWKRVEGVWEGMEWCGKMWESVGGGGRVWKGMAGCGCGFVGVGRGWGIKWKGLGDEKKRMRW